MTITQAELKELLFYDPETGIFTWIKSPNWSLKEGDVAGYKAKNGYIRIAINKKQYKAHRLVWLYVYGTFPEADIDHWNEVKHDNRLRNLRSATKQQNGFNKGKSKCNKSGFKGVSWHKPSKKWAAQATLNGKVKFLGTFTDAAAASEVYQTFATQNHGQFLHSGEG